MSGAGKTYREKRIASRVLGGRPEGKRLLGRTGFSWNMFTTDLTFERKAWIYLIH